MMKQRQSSIRKQLISFGGSLTTLALAILMLGTLVNETLDKRRVLIDAMHVGADVIGRNSAAAILFRDEGDATEVLSSLAGAPQVLHAAIFLPDGTQLAHYHSEGGLGCEHRVASESIAATTTEGLHFSWCSVLLYKSVTLHGQRIGSVALEASLAPLVSSIVFELLFGIIAILVTLLLSLLIWRRFATRITYPLLHLSKVTQQVRRRQDFSLRADIVSHDEVGKLAHDFNLMMGQLQRYDVRLKEELSQRRKVEEQLNQLAYHDSVTGLHNRHYFKEQLEDAIGRAQQYGQSCALLVLDLDGFKKVNDTLGHDMGDELLRQVALRLKKGVRDSDTVCRLGGDEFAIIAKGDATRKQVEQLAARLVEQMAPAYRLEEKRACVTASIGACLCPEQATDKDTLVKNADIAMYQAKEKGKNGYCVYRSAPAAQLDTRCMIENDLHEALASKQFQLHYQPWFTASGRALAGFEALLRWRHPKLGWIMPAEFIPVAEDSGLIIPIGEWVLEQASRQLAAWKQVKPDLTISLNLSGRQLKSEAAVDRLIAILNASPLAHGDIELELTESSLSESTEFIHARMQQLLNAGFLLTLDEFGIGTSTLFLLHDFPFTRIKFHHGFIERIESKPEGQALVRTMAFIGAAMGIGVGAQGVEREAQLDILSAIGCDHVQGAYLGEPMSADEAQALLER